MYEEIGTDGCPKGGARVFKNELAEVETKKEKKTDFGALFGKICEVSTASPFDGQAVQLKIQS